MTQLNWKVIFYLLSATVLWAGNAIAGRLLLASISPAFLSTIRWVLAVLILLPFGWQVLKRGSDLWQHRKRFLLLGLFGVGSYNTLMYLALETSTPINVTLIGASMPIWVLLIGALFFQTRPRFLQLLGALISIIGVAIVISRGDWSAFFAFEWVIGDLFMVLASIGWGTYSWMLSKPGLSNERSWPWAHFLFAQVLIGSLWTIAFTAIEWNMGNIHIELNWLTVILVLFIVIGPSLIAYRLWGLGVIGAGPTVASFFGNLIPLFTALLSTLLLGDPPAPYHGLAFCLIAIGIALSLKEKKSG